MKANNVRLPNTIHPCILTIFPFLPGPNHEGYHWEHIGQHISYWKQANLHLGEITVVALGQLLDIALALHQDPTFSRKIGKTVLLGGAFSINGNVNPAAETNMSYADRDKLVQSNGRFAQYLSRILEVYFSYHREAYFTRGVYLHDPTTILVAINPSLVTFTEGVVRVQTTGITRGLTILYNGQKRFGEHTEWSDKPTVKVAVPVDAPSVVKLVLDRLMES
ncbi:hypothetical protein EUGRSUZ_A00425 [Eucalyptus grandis]|uniref:Uncharacterized protein n=2 Tax=Eucalyptus grandis TaxID=71139 RepID=A0ACC3LZ95_EUCGR|nr:hypothetical protein EUGRSUZ_A00425 [Eucalyptus grandis]